MKDVDIITMELYSRTKMEQSSGRLRTVGARSGGRAFVPHILIDQLTLPLLISTGFLKYPLELKKNFS